MGQMSFSPIDALGAVTGIGSLVAGMDQADAAQEYNYYALRQQKEENQRNREFQSLEAQKQRDFSQAQTDQLLQYNAAPSQVSRLQAAGINPAVAFSKGSGSVGSAMVAPQGGIPAGSSGLNIPPFVSAIEQIAQSGVFMKNLAEMYKTSREGSVVKDLAAAEIKSKMAEANLKDLQAQGQSLANAITQKTGLRRANAEITEMVNRADLYIAEKAREIAQKGLTDAQTNREIEKLTGDVYDNVAKEFAARYGKNKWLMSEIDVRYHKAEVLEGIATLRSQQAANYGTANAQNAVANNQNELARFQRFDNDMRDKFSPEIANNYLQDLAAKNAISDEQYYRAKALVRAVRYGEKHDTDVDQFLRWLSDAVGFSANMSVK